MTDNREESDNYKAIVARLSDDWRVILCRGGIQWILQRRAGAQRHGADRWMSVAFHRLRDGLIKAVQERCGNVSVEAGKVLAQLPCLVTELEAKTDISLSRTNKITSEAVDLGDQSRPLKSIALVERATAMREHV